MKNIKKCINKSHPDFVQLVDKYGMAKAILATKRNNEEIPTLDVAEGLLNVKLSQETFQKQKALAIDIDKQQELVDNLIKQVDPFDLQELNDAIDYMASSDYPLQDAESLFQAFQSYPTRLVGEMLKLKEMYDLHNDILSVEQSDEEADKNYIEEQYQNLNQIRQVVLGTGVDITTSQTRKELSSLAYGTKSAEEFAQKIKSSPKHSKFLVTVENEELYKKLWNFLNEYVPINYVSFKHNKGYRRAGNSDSVGVETNTYTGKKTTFVSKDSSGKNKDKTFFVKQSHALKTLIDNGIDFFMLDHYTEQTYNEYNKNPWGTEKHIRNMTEQHYKELYISSLSNGLTDLGAVSDKKTHVFVSMQDTAKFKTVESAKQFLEVSMKKWNFPEQFIQPTIDDNIKLIDDLIAEKNLVVDAKHPKEFYYRAALNSQYTWLKTQKLLTGFISDFKDQYSFTKRLAGAYAPGMPLDKAVIQKNLGRDKAKVLIVKDNDIQIVIDTKYRTKSGAEKIVKSVRDIKSTDSAMFMSEKRYKQIFIDGSNGIVNGFPGKSVIYEANPTSVFYGKFAIFNISDLNGDDVISQTYSVNGETEFDAILFESAVKRNTQYVDGEKTKTPSADFNDFVTGKLQGGLSSYIKDLDFDSIRIQDTQANRKKASAPYPSQLSEIYFNSSRVVEKLVNASHILKSQKFNDMYSDKFFMFKKFFNPTDVSEYMDRIVSNVPDAIHHPIFKLLSDNLFFTKYRQENMIRRVAGDQAVTMPHVFIDEYMEFPQSYLSTNGEKVEIASVYTSVEYGAKNTEILITRIPTDKLGSAIVAKIIGHLPPEHGNTIVLPPHFMSTSGIDFDKDQIVVWKSLLQKANKNKAMIKDSLKYSKGSTQRKQHLSATIENLSYIGLLSKEDALMEMAFIQAKNDFISNTYDRMIDNTGAKDVYPFFGTEENKDLVSMFWTPRTVIKTAATIDSVKSSIGVEAKMIKNLTLLSDVGYSFPAIRIGNQTVSKFNSIDTKIESGAGTITIEQANSSVLGAAVDAVKDPAPLISIGYNEVTGGMITTAIFGGVNPVDIKKITLHPEVIEYTNFLRGNFPENIKSTANKKAYKQKYSQIVYSVFKKNKFEILSSKKMEDVKVFENALKTAKYSKELEQFILLKGLSDSIRPFGDLMSLTTSQIDDVDFIGTANVAQQLVDKFREFTENKFGVANFRLDFDKFSADVSVKYPYNADLKAISTTKFLTELIENVPNTYKGVSDSTSILQSAINSFVDNKYLNQNYVNSMEELQKYVKDTPEVFNLYKKINAKFETLVKNKTGTNTPNSIMTDMQEFRPDIQKLSAKNRYALTYALMSKQIGTKYDKNAVNSLAVNLAYTLGDVNTLREFSKEVRTLMTGKINTENRTEAELFGSAYRLYENDECV